MINVIINSIFIVWLGLVSFMDIRKKQVSKPMLLIGSFIGILLFIFNQEVEIISKVLGLAIGLFFYLLHKISRGQMGLGDVVVLFIISIGYGMLESIQIILASFFFLFIVSMFLFLIKKVNRKYELPYLPFLFLGVVTLWI